MSQNDPKMMDLLERIGAAFNAHDLDAIVEMFADDGVFDAPAGGDIWGTRHAGKDAIRAALGKLFAAYPDLRWEPVRNWTNGTMGCAEWRRTATGPNGEKLDWLGCDLFQFRGDKVVRKDSYFKIVT